MWTRADNANENITVYKMAARVERDMASGECHLICAGIIQK
jgi:hypothetical protein